MKNLIENWQKYLNEQTSLFNYEIRPEEKVFISAKKFKTFQNTKQRDQSALSISVKPSGLWYSCGDDWIDFLSHELPSMLQDAKYLYRVELGEGVYQISNEKEFKNFEKKYIFTPKHFANLGFDNSVMGAIDWHAVQNDGFTGIEICPYLGSQRFQNWYYPWDVASGCIWDSKGIKNIELIARKKKKK